jgi:hypothetical protein
LGLSFCPRPRLATYDVSDFTQRFRRDIFTKAYFAHRETEEENFNPKLFIRSEWEPDQEAIPDDLKKRTDVFLKEITSLFKKRRSPPSLLYSQRQLLKNLQNNSDFMVVVTDKNLGPAIIEREVYIKRCLTDHLHDEATYRQLSHHRAQGRIKTITLLLENFLSKYEDTLQPYELKFLKRSMKTENPLPQFYITFKVHKRPWKTRPICSVSGSLLHGLGKWVDTKLQPICQKLPSFINSSFTLITHLKGLPPLPANARLFTADAVSMYTNIDTIHALAQITQFFRRHHSYHRKDQ